jgi:hypothetical protein
VIERAGAGAAGLAVSAFFAVVSTLWARTANEKIMNMKEKYMFFSMSVVLVKKR